MDKEYLNSLRNGYTFYRFGEVFSEVIGVITLAEAVLEYHSKGFDQSLPTFCSGIGAILLSKFIGQTADDDKKEIAELSARLANKKELSDKF